MTDASVIAVTGAGAWGTALALAAIEAGRMVTLLTREPATAAELSKARASPKLPGLQLPESLRITADPGALSTAGTILLAVPAQALSAYLAAIAPHVAPDASLVITAKGLERPSGRFLHEIAAERFGAGRVLVLSGPSFAADVARGLPTAITVAGATIARAEGVAKLISARALRVYWSDDIVGVALGGAVKNVLAIAAGIVIGRGLGESARAALIARGFSELQRLASAEGARPETLFGLSGLGDLVLTATSPTSRNYAFGLAIGRGESVAAASAASRGVAEGVETASAVLARARSRQVDVPITEAVAACLAGQRSVDEAVARLMQRPLKGET